MTPDHGELLYEGKAKRVFASTDSDQVLVEFKNDATAFNAQKKAQLDDKGRLNCQISALLFELLEREGVPTHYCGLAGETWMLVRRVEIIPLEVVLRNTATGSPSTTSKRLPASRQRCCSSTRLSIRNQSRAGAIGGSSGGGLITAGSCTYTPVTAGLICAAATRPRLSARRRSRRCQNRTRDVAIRVREAAWRGTRR